MKLVEDTGSRRKRRWIPYVAFVLTPFMPFLYFGKQMDIVLRGWYHVIVEELREVFDER